MSTRCATAVVLILQVCAVGLMSARAGEQRVEPSAIPANGGSAVLQGLITNAAVVRGMTPDEASRRLPVRFQGVVTFIFNPRSCFVQDESAGIFVGNGVQFPGISAGDTVVVEGECDPGDYAPLVRPARVQLIGHGKLPPAPRVTFTDLMTGHEDSQLVEIVGLVRAAFTDSQGQALAIDMGGGRVTVYVPSLEESQIRKLIDSAVRLRGVCGTWFNKQRQLFGVRLMVPSWQDVTVEEPGTADVWEQPARPIGGLLRFTPQGSYGHQVKVAGTVVLQQPGRALFLQDEQHGLYVQTRQTGTLNPGDRVEVVGFPDKGEYTPVVQDATWRKVGSGPEPEPVPVQPDEALSGIQDSRLVTIEGNLLDHTHTEQGTTLIMGVGGHVFSARLESSGGGGMALGSLRNQSQLRVRGVCRIEVGEDWQAGPAWRAKSFYILLRSPGDVQVLSLPPFWSLGRLLWAVAILVAVILAFLLWVTILRVKVRQQTFIIRQKLDLEARLKERYRDLFESANDMVYTHDIRGRITSINLAGEQFLGRDRASIVNKSLPDFIAEEQRPAAQRWLEEIAGGTAPATAEWDFLGANGQRLRLETSARLIAHDGQEVEVEGIARDVTEQRRLEKEILEVSTREQHRIGHDLHDGVCQQLAGIAVLADVLADKLDDQGRVEAGDAQKITELVRQVNRQTRGVARGLFPVRLEENGLVSALQELAENAGVFYSTPCTFRCDKPVVVSDHSVARHLYFIAQEAIVNAVKHGKAGLVEVNLAPADNHGCILTVRDNGGGLRNGLPSGPGMGIRIMKYRARMIGASLSLQTSPKGGVEVICQFIPKPKPNGA